MPRVRVPALSARLRSSAPASLDKRHHAWSSARSSDCSEKAYKRGYLDKSLKSDSWQALWCIAADTIPKRIAFLDHEGV